MNDPPRILHVISQLNGYGHARMLRRLSTRQAAAGANVTVAPMNAGRDIVHELRQAGVSVEIIGSRWPIDPLAAIRLHQLLRKTSTWGVVHAWDLQSFLHLAWRPRYKPAEKLLVELDLEDVESRSAQRALRYFQVRADRFVTHDETARRQLCSLGIHEQRFQKIPFGVPSAAQLASDRAAWLARWEFPPTARVIATAGPLVRSKAFDEAVWCYELVRVLYPEVRLLIIGDGPDRPRLERFADDVSEPGCIRFLGYQPDISQVLGHADVYWQLTPSHLTPLALLEAQAAGVPVVISDVPAHRPAIEPETTGLVVALGNRAEVARATDDLFRDPQRAKRMGAAGAAFVAARWSLDCTLAAYDELYAQVASSRIE